MNDILRHTLMTQQLKRYSGYAASPLRRMGSVFKGR